MKNKIFKIFSILVSVSSISATSLTVMSCGHKNNDKADWENFKKETLNEAAINIVDATLTPNWSDVKASELSIKFVVDSTEKKITATIDRTVQYEKLTTAIFEIDFKIGAVYNVDSWLCITMPQPKTNTWAGYKYFASKVTADDLLAQAKKIRNWKDFKWTYGTKDQNVWIAKDQPEFDIYGGMGGSDPYKGMAGAPTANETSQTITAIISKKGQEGVYDSDPIEATIKYDKTKLYNISEWTFKTTEQLQSFPKWKSIYLAQQPSDFQNFQKENWLESVEYKGTTNKNFEQEARNREFSIDDVLNKTGFPNHKSPVFSGNHSAGSIDSITGGYRAKSSFDFHVHVQDSHDLIYALNIYIDFIYKNTTTKTGGGTAFHYTWFGTIIEE